MLKRSVVMVMAALVMASSIPAFAQQKDECLLASQNCKDQVDSIQQKMQRLRTEIKKGKKVYTAQELSVLKEKLKDVNAQLDDLLKPGR